MLRSLFVIVVLAAGCAAAPPPPAETPSAACLRLDERAGVPPAARRECWQRVAAAGDLRLAEHAAARVRALDGATVDPLVSDAPAALHLDPGPPGTLAPPPATPTAAASPACLERARSCDAGCTGSSAWADCLGRCDEDLGRCLYAPPTTLPR